MSYLLIVVLCLATTPDAPRSSSDDPADVSPAARSPRELRAAIRTALRSEATATTAYERNAASRLLCALYAQVQDNSVMSPRSRVQWADKIRSRLLRVKKRLEAEISRKNDRLQRATSASTSKTISATARNDFVMGGQAQPDDNGVALVELIQQTIRPNIWDVNGGEASIVYFAPLRALVVRAPGGIHRRTGDLLNRLRVAGP